MKKNKADEVIHTDISNLIKSVTKDISKDFDLAEAGDLEFLSTGNAGINYAISGKFDGGFPISRITELAGANSTGKSLLAQHALVETQRKKGIAVLVDTEFAFNPEWYRGLGGDPDTLIVYQAPHIDAVYSFIKKVVDSTRAKDKDIPITIVYDSVAASPSKLEYEGAEHDMGKRAIAHGKGIRMLMNLCGNQKVTFIAINQYRKLIGVMYGPDEDTTGGMAWKYACSVRIKMKKGKKIETKTDIGEKVVGVHGSISVEKNRCRSPFAAADFDIYFDKGIDPVSGLFDVLVNDGVIQRRRNEEGKPVQGWWTYKDLNFQKTNFPQVYTKYPELLGGHTPIEIDDNLSIEGDGDEEYGDTVSTEADM